MGIFDKQSSKSFMRKGELEDFFESNMGKLEKMKASLINIKAGFLGEDSEIRKQIDVLEADIDTEIVSLEVRDADKIRELVESDTLEELERGFSKLSNLSSGKYAAYGVEQQISLLDKIFESIGGTGYSSDYNEQIKEIENSIGELSKHRSSLQGIELNKLQYLLIKARYRIITCRMLFDMSDYGHKLDNNPFNKVSNAEKILYAKMMFDDVDNSVAQIDEVDEFYRLTKTDKKNTHVDKREELIDEIDTYLVKDTFTLIEMFDSLDFLKKFAEYKVDLNREVYYSRNSLSRKQREEAERQEKERQAAEEADKKEAERQIEVQKLQVEMQELKDLTPEEIRKEINRIYNDLSADGNKHINILEYQKGIARAKGLLTDNNEFRNERLYHMEVLDSELAEVIQKANSQGINYTVLLSNTERKGKNPLVIVSNSDKEKIEPEKFKGTKSNSEPERLNFGTYPAYIINKYVNRSVLSNDSRNFFITKTELGMFKYTGINTTAEQREPFVKKIYEDVLKIDADEAALEDIKFYITVPVQRNIIPILEELSSAEIDYYFEPVPTEERERSTTNRETVNIYMDRRNLDRYREEVHNKISTPDRGAIIVGGDKISLRDLVMSGIEFPPDILAKLEEQTREEI